MKTVNEKAVNEMTVPVPPVPREADRRGMVGAGLAALVGFVVSACGDDDPAPVAPGTGAGGAGAGGSNAGGAAGGSTGVDADVGILNALLTAEYQATTAYKAGAGILQAPAATDPLKDLAPILLATATAFLMQHQLHAEALVTQIKALGGTPVVEETVAASFTGMPSDDLKTLLGNPSISNLLKFATKAELAAAIAYTEVVGSLEAAKTRLLATSIGGDESQHFIVLAALAIGLAAPTPALTAENAGGAVPFAFVAKVDDDAKHTSLSAYKPFFA